jgi:hypothetical protein
MIVRQDDRGCTQRECWTEDLSRLERGDIQAADRHPFAGNRLISRVEIEDGEAFSWTGAEVLELEQRLSRGGNRRRRGIGGDVPSSRQLANGQEPPDLGRPEAVPPGCLAKVRNGSFNQGAFGEEGFNSRDVSWTPDQAGKESRLVGFGHP